MEQGNAQGPFFSRFRLGFFPLGIIGPLYLSPLVVRHLQGSERECACRWRKDLRRASFLDLITVGIATDSMGPSGNLNLGLGLLGAVILWPCLPNRRANICFGEMPPTISISRERKPTPFPETLSHS